MDNRSLQLSLQVGIQIYLYLFHSILFTVVHYFGSQHPLFLLFFKTINSSIYNWFGYGATTAGMVLGETSFYFPIFLGLISILLLSGSVLRLSSYFYHLINSKSTSISPINRLCIFAAGAVCIGLCLFGIRGRMGYNPIRVSQAYYCTDPFLNQLGVNPVFNLLTSTLDDNRKENRYLHLMPEQEAITNMQSILQRKGIEGISPLHVSEMHSRPYTKECCSYFHGIDVGQLDGAFRIYQKTDSFPRQPLSGISQF